MFSFIKFVLHKFPSSPKQSVILQLLIGYIQLLVLQSNVKYKISLTIPFEIFVSQVSVLADDVLKNVEYDALRIVFNKFQSVVSFLPTMATVLSPEVIQSVPAIICMHFGFVSRIVVYDWIFYLGCGERGWIWWEAWWSWFLWDWRWWNKGWNTSESCRVPIFLCKCCLNLFFSEQFLGVSPFLKACMNYKPRLET